MSEYEDLIHKMEESKLNQDPVVCKMIDKLMRQRTKISRKENYKDYRKEKNREYYLQNRDSRLAQSKKEYHDTVKQNKVQCECGRTVLACKLKVHLNSKIHERNLENKNNFP